MRVKIVTSAGVMLALLLVVGWSPATKIPNSGPLSTESARLQLALAMQPEITCYTCEPCLNQPDNHKMDATTDTTEFKGWHTCIPGDAASCAHPKCVGTALLPQQTDRLYELAEELAFGDGDALESLKREFPDYTVVSSERGVAQVLNPCATSTVIASIPLGQLSRASET